MDDVLTALNLRNTEALFTTAALITITSSSALCSQDVRQQSTWACLIGKVLWLLSALCFVAISTQGETPSLHVITLFALSLCDITMLWIIARIGRQLLAILPLGKLESVIAKHTVFWRLWHVRAGTYQAAIRRLHSEQGELAQVGPYEYSLSNPAYFERCGRFDKVPSALLPYQLRRTEDAAIIAPEITTANLDAVGSQYRIEAYNAAFIRALVAHAEAGETADLGALVTRYVYDMLFAACAGQHVAFQDRPMIAKKVTKAIDSWKFYAVLYGSYLRFHPWIRTIASYLLPYANIKGLELTSDGRRDVAKDLYPALSEEASVALLLARADPTVSLIVTSLYYIYKDPKLLGAICNEIKLIRSYVQPPRLHLLMRYNRLPLLHAVIGESWRLRKETTNACVAPEGGVYIGEKHVPEKSTIHLQPFMAPFHPGFETPLPSPEQWLTDEELEAHMLAYGANPHQTSDQELQTALIIKLLVQLLPHVNLDMSFTETVAPVMPEQDIPAELGRHRVNVNLTDGDGNTTSTIVTVRICIPQNVVYDKVITESTEITEEALAPETTSVAMTPARFHDHRYMDKAERVRRNQHRAEVRRNQGYQRNNHGGRQNANNNYGGRQNNNYNNRQQNGMNKSHNQQQMHQPLAKNRNDPKAVPVPARPKAGAAPMVAPKPDENLPPHLAIWAALAYGESDRIARMNFEEQQLARDADRFAAVKRAEAEMFAAKVADREKVATGNIFNENFKVEGVKPVEEVVETRKAAVPPHLRARKVSE